MTQQDTKAPEEAAEGQPSDVDEGQAEGRRGGTPLAPEHKMAMAQGRNHTRIIRNYLDALVADRDSRGRRRARKALEAKLVKIEHDMATAEDPLRCVALLQQRIDASDQLHELGDIVNMDELEAQFVAIVGPYSERKGISRQAWREFGVEAKVLSAAGIS